MGTTVTTRQQELAERLLQVNQAKFLDQIEELLVRAEMQARADEALEDIANGSVISLEEFLKGNQEWLKARGIK